MGAAASSSEPPAMATAAAVAGADVAGVSGSGEGAAPSFYVLFSSDNHGNNAQYAAVVAAAVERRVGAVVFGGDLAPKCQYMREVDYFGRMAREQREWIGGAFASALAPLRAARIPVYVIMGNGDVSVNYDAHIANEAAGLYTLVDCARVPLATVGGIGYDLVGLPFVPCTGSSMKDFDMHDTVIAAADGGGAGGPVDSGSSAPAGAPAAAPAGKNPPWYAIAVGDTYNPRATYADEPPEYWPRHSRLQRSVAAFRAPEAVPTGWHGVHYTASRSATHSLEVVLAGAPYTRVPGRRTILVSHAPPFATCGDMIGRPRKRKGGRGYGSVCRGRGSGTGGGGGGGATTGAAGGSTGAAPPPPPPACRWCTAFRLPPAAREHTHIGSVALRAYIARERPWATLSGHIHGTVEAAGRAADVVHHAGGSATVVIASGNDPLYTADGTRECERSAEVPVGKVAWAVLFDVAAPAKAVRLELRGGV